MFHLYNGLVLLLILTGVLFRHYRKIHVPIMVFSFVLDISSVFYLEFSRSVIQEALGHASEKIVQFHLVCAVATLLGYGIAIFTGRRLLRGAPIHLFHRINAILFLMARTGIFVSSFWVHS